MNKDGRFPPRNAEGYPDPTAYDALQSLQAEWEEEETRLSRVIKIIKLVLDLCGFELVDRIVLRDKKSGRLHR